MQSELISLAFNQDYYGGYMDIMKKFLVLLAIFCIIGSAAAVSAADVSDDLGNYADTQYQDDSYVDSQYQDGGYAGSQYQDDGGWAGSQYDENEQGGYAGSQYQDDGGWAGSQYNETLENAAGAPVNATANATASHTMPATGNPILLLFAVGAVLGGAAVIKRRK